MARHQSELDGSFASTGLLKGVWHPAEAGSVWTVHWAGHPHNKPHRVLTDAAFLSFLRSPLHEYMQRDWAWSCVNALNSNQAHVDSQASRRSFFGASGQISLTFPFSEVLR